MNCVDPAVTGKALKVWNAFIPIPEIKTFDDGVYTRIALILLLLIKLFANVDHGVTTGNNILYWATNVAPSSGSDLVV